MIELLLLATLIGGVGIAATNSEPLEGNTNQATPAIVSHQQTNPAMRSLAPIIARQHRKDPAAASAQISNLSFGDKDWMRYYAHRRMHSRLFGWDTKNLLELITLVSKQMRNRVRLVGGGTAATTTLIGTAMLFGFMSAKILKHTFIMAMYGFGAAICLLASLFIVAYLVREEGLFASTFGNLSSLRKWDKTRLVRMLSKKMQGYINATSPILNPSGPVISTARDMRSIIDDMGPLHRLLARLFG